MNENKTEYEIGQRVLTIKYGNGVINKPKIYREGVIIGKAGTVYKIGFEHSRTLAELLLRKPPYEITEWIEGALIVGKITERTKLLKIPEKKLDK